MEYYKYRKKEYITLYYFNTLETASRVVIATITNLEEKPNLEKAKAPLLKPL